MQLIIDNISKTYDNGVQALQGISLKIPKGMFGLLGPNGAGKSTLMRTIATLQNADSGHISFNDLDIYKDKNAIRKVLGYLPQQFGVYPKMSAEILLNHLAVLKGITNKKERKEVVHVLLDRTNLYEVRKQNLGGFSGGMKQRFGIAQALLNNPKLLIVDEPTAGLDPKERNRFYNLLSEIAENTIVILSTHIVDDIKELCHQMAIINRGEVILKGKPLDLIEQVQGKVYQKTIDRSEFDTYKNQYQVINETFFMGKPVVQIMNNSNPGNGFEPINAGLEEVYFSQINQSK
ncbi:ABC transporter ATP-binding protein [uncultured Aquimarina sp.]|uniref:ABC transporter ATP-binding protein n=1 Tax=uncultured Aquimarina sp. TaxID=575652 RepID=UPI00261BF6B5|nr:ABC transporter ATP-binding protein [uncultured Aquimarina sp.]